MSNKSSGVSTSHSNVPFYSKRALQAFGLLMVALVIACDGGIPGFLDAGGVLPPPPAPMGPEATPPVGEEPQQIEQDPPAIPKTATITGQAIIPELDIEYVNGLPGGGLSRVLLFDLSWNQLDVDESGEWSFRFTVDTAKAYLLVAEYAGGQGFGAVTPTITGDTEQNIDIDSELAFNLIIATEQAFDNLEPSSLSRPLDDLLADADGVVADHNTFLDDRRFRRADRMTDALRAMLLDALNQGRGVSITDLGLASLRAYGGGLQPLRSLSAMLEQPLSPLTPHFTFTRYNSMGEFDVGMSDLDNARWDYLESGIFPHIVPGGNVLIFIQVNGTVSIGGQPLLGIFMRTLGTDDAPTLVTPSNLTCVFASLSPDQTKIAFSGRFIDLAVEENVIGGPPRQLFVMNVDGSNVVQLTADEDLFPDANDENDGVSGVSWSPDGSEIVFDTKMNHGGGFTAQARLEIIRADGSGRRVFFDAGETGYRQPSDPQWSPDGRRILFAAVPPGEGDFELIVAPADFDPVSNPDFFIFTDNDARDETPAWTNDGRYIIFISNRGGEAGTFPGNITDLFPIHVINAYTSAVVAEMGDFASAGFYVGPRFTMTEFMFTSVDGQQTDEFGNVVFGSGGDDRQLDQPSSNTYYREIIPAGNAITDAFGSPAINWTLPSW